MFKTRDGYEVIHLNLGGALSSAHQNCMLAAEELPGVYPIDSYNLSTGIALLVIAAGDMIRRSLAAARYCQASQGTPQSLPCQFYSGYP